MKAGDSSFSKSFAMLTNLGGNLSLFNPCLDSARKEFSCRYGFTLQTTSVCSREPVAFQIIPTDAAKSKSVRRITHLLLY
jgi:hypothetical protein